MAKTIFAKISNTYIMQGGYILPDLALSTEEKRSIGVWGQRRLR